MDSQQKGRGRGRDLGVQVPKKRGLSGAEERREELERDPFLLPGPPSLKALGPASSQPGPSADSLFPSHPLDSKGRTLGWPWPWEKEPEAGSQET